MPSSSDDKPSLAQRQAARGATGGAAALLAVAGLAGLQAAVLLVGWASGGLGHVAGHQLVATALLAGAPVVVFGVLHLWARAAPPQEGLVPCAIGLVFYGALFGWRTLAAIAGPVGLVGTLVSFPTVIGAAILLALYSGIRASTRYAELARAGPPDASAGAPAGGGLAELPGEGAGAPQPPGSPAVQTVIGLLVLLLMLGGMFAFARSGSYRLSRARGLETGGELAGAAELYAELIDEGGPNAKTARTNLDHLLRALLPDAPLPTIRDALVAVAEASAARPDEGGGGLVADAEAVHAFIAIAEQRCAEDPDAAQALLDAIEPWVGDPIAVERARGEVLEALAKRGVASREAALELARLAERRGELALAGRVLDPHRSALGEGGDGARILGRALAERGELAPAIALLAGPVEAGLAELDSAEKRVEAAYEEAAAATVQWVESGNAPESFHAELQRVPTAEREAWIASYLGDRIADHAPLAAAREALRDVSRTALPTAVDLAVAHVRFGQSSEASAEARAESVARAESLLARLADASRWPDSGNLVGERVAEWLARDELAPKDRDYLTGWARVMKVALPTGR